VAPPKIPTQIEAKIVVAILTGIIGALLASFLMMGCIAETNETGKMKACVTKGYEWVAAPGGPECRKPLDTAVQPSYDSNNETDKPQ
jgi:hypothetical protein